MRIQRRLWITRHSACPACPPSVQYSISSRSCSSSNGLSVWWLVASNSLTRTTYTNLVVFRIHRINTNITITPNPVARCRRYRLSSRRQCPTPHASRLQTKPYGATISTDQKVTIKSTENVSSRSLCHCHAMHC